LFLYFEKRPYWIQYKYLKKKLKGFEKRLSADQEISKVPEEVDFFKELRSEVDDCSRFFDSTEILYKLRYQRVLDGYTRLKESVYHEKLSLHRLIRSCVNLYRDVLLLENFANINYSGFSKILKKHDKNTNYVTRNAFMRNVVMKRNFAKCKSLEELV
jgi:SPX domain protein involved in polyphosphate accumulation